MKKILALMLVALLTLEIMPFSVLAEENPETNVGIEITDEEQTEDTARSSNPVVVGSEEETLEEEQSVDTAVPGDPVENGTEESEVTDDSKVTGDPEEPAEEEPIDSAVDEGLEAEAETSTLYKETPDSDNFTNVVLFVNFADTTHAHEYLLDSYTCFMEKPNIETLFTGSNAMSLRQYLYNISYGKLKVTSIFPQYDADSGKIVPYTLPGNAVSYENDTLALAAAEALRDSGTITSDMNLDRNNDGCIDNLMIIVPCESGNSNTHFYGVSWGFAGNVSINGDTVASCNIIPESRAYLPQSSGVIVHECLHTIGYPDLYRAENDADNYPVGTWDIMASATQKLQFPLAYLRSGFTKWFSIPTVTADQMGYTIYSAEAATSEHKDEQAVILKTGYSDTEFFVLEYREKSDDFGSGDYDYTVYGSGLIIYRVNNGLSCRSNHCLGKNFIYVFRPGDDFASGGIEQGYGDITKSFLSAESGRTCYGSAESAATLSDGALVYSDGTNSGIVISNVGSAAGDTISFDITFNEVGGEGDEGYWQTDSHESTATDYTVCSCTDGNGSIYALQNNSGTLSVVKFASSDTGNVWTDYGKTYSDSDTNNYHEIAYYNGDIYVLSLAESGLTLLKCTQSGWTKVKSISDASTYAVMAASSTGLYLAYSNSDCTAVTVAKYNGSGVTSLGTALTSSNMLCNPHMDVSDSTVVVTASEFPLSFGDNDATNRLNTALYDGSWRTVDMGGLKANAFDLKLHGSTIYLLKNGTTSSDYSESYLYMHPLSTTGEWAKACEDAFTTVSAPETALFFMGDAPYLLYQDGTTGKSRVLFIENGAWQQLGNDVSTTAFSGLNAFVNGDKIYAVYLADSSITVRIHDGSTKAESGAHTHRYQSVITTPATCTEDGLMTYTCSVCGDSYTEVIAATGHTAVTDAAVAPTCTASGLTTGSHCSACGLIFTAQQTIPATGHTEVVDAAVAPTCTTAGKTAGSHCSVCNEVLVAQEEIPATGHTAVNGNDQYSTLWEEGMTGGSRCAVCGAVLVRPAVIEKQGLNNVTVSISKTTATVMWGKLDGAAGYEIWRSTSENGEYTKITTINKPKTVKYKNTKLLPGTCYYYYVVAYNAAGVYTGKSNIVSVQVALTAPSVTLKKSGATGVKISWKKISGAEGYRVYMDKGDGAGYQLIATTSALTYTETVSPAGNYSVMVSAYSNRSGFEITSPMSKARTLKLKFSAPSLKAKKTAPTTVTLSWKAVAGATSYEVQYALSKKGEYTTIYTGSGTGFEHTVAPGATYYYRIIAISDIGGRTVSSSWSAVRNVKVK